eukprot:12937569-Prorocentrum_lima.AAC.1
MREEWVCTLSGPKPRGMASAGVGCLRRGGRDPLLASLTGMADRLLREKAFTAWLMVAVPRPEDDAGDVGARVTGESAA